MEKSSTHLAGEYFVAAELYRRGFSVETTIGNAKAIDLFVHKDNRIISVQVKAIQNKKNSGWRLMSNKIVEGVLYVFVNLNDQENPDYYIATAEETTQKIIDYGTHSGISLKTLTNDQFLNRWDKLELVEKFLVVITSKGSQRIKGYNVSVKYIHIPEVEANIKRSIIKDILKGNKKSK